MGGRGEEKKKGEKNEKEITLRDNSLTGICSFLELKKWEVSLERVDAFSPSDYTRSHQHLTRGCGEHGSAIYKHHPRIPETLM